MMRSAGPLGPTMRRLRGNTDRIVLAAMLDVKESYLANIEGGWSNTSSRTLDRFCKVLHLTAEQRDELYEARRQTVADIIAQGEQMKAAIRGRN